jgi:hypothetical protein
MVGRARCTQCGVRSDVVNAYHFGGMYARARAYPIVKCLRVRPVADYIIHPVAGFGPGLLVSQTTWRRRETAHHPYIVSATLIHCV